MKKEFNPSQSFRDSCRDAFLVLVIMMVFGFCSAAEEEKSYGTVLCSELVRVYDGDTFTVNIDSWPDIIGKEVGIRVYGIDTPEMTDPRPEIRKLAMDSKSFAHCMLFMAKKIELRNIMRDKYFRIVADVYVDGVSLGKELIKKGLAKKYDGGTKEAW